MSYGGGGYPQHPQHPQQQQQLASYHRDPAYYHGEPGHGGGVYSGGGGGGGVGVGVGVPPPRSWRSLSDRVRGQVLALVADECSRRTYSSFAAQDASTVVAERAMLALREWITDFKLIINVVVMPRGLGGLHSTSTSWWDSAHDGSTVVRWENSSLIVVVTVYGLCMEVG